MIRNNKKYKVFTTLHTDIVEKFVEYCKKENKVIAKEIQEAIEFYLNNKINIKINEYEMDNLKELKEMDLQKLEQIKNKIEQVIEQKLLEELDDKNLPF